MTPLFTSLKLFEVYHLKNLLATEGIATFVNNELLSRLAGEIPFTECAPQLCLIREADRPVAEQLLAEFMRAPPARAAWHCRQCGEISEGQFSNCWRCGTERTS